MTVPNHTRRLLDVKQHEKKSLFIERILSECPTAGTGVHLWLFRAARQMHAHYGQMQIVELLADAVRGCGRPVPMREIQDAVRQSASCAWQPSCETGTYSTPAPKPAPVADIAERAAKTGMNAVDLFELSPVRLEECPPSQILPMLYPPDALLCLGRAANDFQTRPLNEWLTCGDLTDYCLIVPSPMSSVWGTTKDGKQSQRCLSNCGPRRWLCAEFDSGDADSQASRLWFLASSFKLKLVCWSGSKSLHGWFDAKDTDIDAFYAIAVSLNADPATQSPCQLVRMPNAIRDNGNRQGVLFFDNQ